MSKVSVSAEVQMCHGGSRNQTVQSRERGAPEGSSGRSEAANLNAATEALPAGERRPKSQHSPGDWRGTGQLSDRHVTAVPDREKGAETSVWWLAASQMGKMCGSRGLLPVEAKLTQTEATRRGEWSRKVVEE